MERQKPPAVRLQSTLMTEPNTLRIFHWDPLWIARRGADWLLASRYVLKLKKEPL